MFPDLGQIVDKTKCARAAQGKRVAFSAASDQVREFIIAAAEEGKTECTFYLATEEGYANRVRWDESCVITTPGDSWLVVEALTTAILAGLETSGFTVSSHFYRSWSECGHDYYYRPDTMDISVSWGLALINRTQC